MNEAINSDDTIVNLPTLLQWLQVHGVRRTPATLTDPTPTAWQQWIASQSYRLWDWPRD